ncbi:hypothetical protein [Arthrobacter sp. H16F315]|uniref:hypothetical protein n=1 Tax=Arthrobacter sp. H16F315 TaxID=2955314 RepID=UPI002097DAF7|nr:hypothetical protein [Arthrobacter sp. H16F315]MDD1475483.1 hypothetical protein [Arthrobacter sp. H16F315]
METAAPTEPPGTRRNPLLEILQPAERPLTDEELVIDKAWKISPQRAIARRNSLITLATGLVAALAAVFFFFVNEVEYLKSFFWILAAYVGLLITLLAATFQLTEKRRQFLTEYSLNQLAEENAEQDSVELAALWKANKNQLGHYHQIVMNYAESTKRSTAWYLIAGFLLVAAMGLMTIFATTAESAIASTAIAAAAAGLTGFVAKAVLRNASTASSELQMFFNHPLEVERALAAERLVDAFETEERRDEARLLIIQSLTRERPQLKAAPSDFASAAGTEHPPSSPAR